MAIGWTFEDAFKTSSKALDETRVDCTRCPVSFQCISNVELITAKWACCNSICVDVMESHVIVDCAHNAFRSAVTVSPAYNHCPLCNGDIVKNVMLGWTHGFRYLPTVHAKVPSAVRLKCWKTARPAALELQAQIHKRKEGKK